MAIFEFSSSNGFSSFNLNFECRYTDIRDIGDENQSHFSYLINLLPDLRSDVWCQERSYEEWGSFCITSLQG